MFNQIKEFVAGVLIVLESAQHRARHRHRVLLFDTTHDHAEMLSLDNDSHAPRLNLFSDGVGNLSGQAFLHLKPPGEHVDKTWNLAEPDYAAVRDVTDVAFSEKRQKVMLAQAENFDVADDDHLVISDVKKRPTQNLVCIHAIAAGQKPHCLVYSKRSVLQAIARWILADLFQDRPDFINHAGLV